MKIKFLKVKGTWREVADAARTTIRQDEGTKEPSSKWKKRILLAEHSPIRKLNFNWKWVDLPYWVSVHFVRHKFGIEHFVSTQRTDRTGVEREANRQDAPVMHECYANAQAVMFISRRRLCAQASAETRAAWRAVVDAIGEKEPEVAAADSAQNLRRVAFLEAPLMKKCLRNIARSSSCTILRKYSIILFYWRKLNEQRTFEKSTRKNSFYARFG